MKDQIKEVRDKLANKDSMDPEEIKKTVNELQQQSLKLFEMAYKKVRRSVLLLFSIDKIGSLFQCGIADSEGENADRKELNALYQLRFGMVKRLVMCSCEDFSSNF